MLNRILGAGSGVQALKEGLGTSSERVRTVAERVANAANNDFATELEADGGRWRSKRSRVWV